MDTSWSFSDAEWTLLRTVAEGLEWSFGWQPAPAQRVPLRAGLCVRHRLRASELVYAKLRRAIPHWMMYTLATRALQAGPVGQIACADDTRRALALSAQT
jgi:hypothetical protein